MSVRAVHLVGSFAPTPKRCCVAPFDPNFLSYGSQRSPLRRPSTARPLPERLPKKVSLRCEAATPHTRAILVVSHHLDGLLRIVPCRFVAPCSGHGVRHVSGPPPPDPALIASDEFLICGRMPFPSGAKTLRSFPLASSPCRVTATGSLSTLASAPAPLPSMLAHLVPVRRLGGPDLRALFHCRVRCSRAGVATNSLPGAPLGFIHQEMSCLVS